MHDTINGAMFKEMLLFGTVSITQAQQAINDLNVFPVPDGDTGTNMSLTIQTAAQELKQDRTRDGRPGRLCHGVRAAARRARQLRRHSVACCSAASPRSSRAARRPTARHSPPRCQRGRRRGLQRRDEARRGHDPHRLPPGRRAAAGDRGRGAQRRRIRPRARPLRQGETTLAQTDRHEPRPQKGRRGGRGRQGLPRHPRAVCSAPCGGERVASRLTARRTRRRRRTSPCSTTRTSPSPSTPCSSSARRADTATSTPLRALSRAASATASSSARTTRPSRSTSTPNIPGEALSEAAEIRHARAGEDREHAHCSTTICAGRRKAAVHRRSRGRRAGARGRAQETAGRAREALRHASPCAQATAWPACSASWAPTGSSSGGQTMNPSTRGHPREDRTSHARRRPCSCFPNNKNIIMAAQQSAGLTEKKVVVIPTASIPQGVSAMMAVDPDMSDETPSPRR